LFAINERGRRGCVSLFYNIIIISLLEKRKEEASFIGWVSITEKGKKDKVILVVGRYRLLALKSGGKVNRFELHFIFHSIFL